MKRQSVRLAQRGIRIADKRVRNQPAQHHIHGNDDFSWQIWDIRMWGTMLLQQEFRFRIHYREQSVPLPDNVH